MDKLLRNASGDIQLDLPQAPDNAPTVVVKDSAGTTVVSGGTTQVGTDTTLYKFTLSPANLSAVDTYTATWTAIIAGVADTYTSQFEVVGGFYFTIEQLRAFDPTITQTAHSDAKVVKARDAAEERLEQLMGVSYRRRGIRRTLDGTGDADLWLPEHDPRLIVSGSISGTALTAGDIADLTLYPNGRITRKTLGSWGAGVGNVTLFYEYGQDTPPEPVRRAAMALARANLVGNELWSRRSGEQSDAGFWRITMPGRSGPTGIPEVDAIIEQFGRRVPAIW